MTGKLEATVPQEYECTSAAPSGLDERAGRIVFVGTLPPPVTGMTEMTRVVVEALQARATVKVFNWSPGRPLRGWRWKLLRAWGFAKSLVRLPFYGRGRGGVFYYAVSSGFGLFYDLALASLAKVLGYRVVLHHHSYAYINHRDRRAAWLDLLVGRRGAHVVHCQLMQEHFYAMYPTEREFIFVPPTIVSQQLEPVYRRSHGGFTLGFMSNLSLEKGLDNAISTFERLAESGRDVRLVLAGPCMDGAAKSLVDAATARWRDRVEYRGPVYGRDKAQFFADVDAFLFPTRYNVESWGIVLTESLSAGRPVIARSRGCVPWIVRGACGVVVDREGDFVAVATRQIVTWMDSPAVYQAAQAGCRERTKELEADANRELPALVDRLVAMSRS